MKKPFFLSVIISILFLTFVYFRSSNINFYNTEFLHPLFWLLIPVTCLLFLCIFLRGIKPKSVFVSIFIFGVLSFLILSAVDPVCSGIVCYDRSTSALLISSLFSIAYFIILLFKNRKQST